MPDTNARALRTRDGLAVFALHYEARALRGPDFDHLKIDCRPALVSGENDDPARYDGRRYVAALWTQDGAHVAALAHNEYHAEIHPGRCVSRDGLACWWNAIIGVQSADGARSFTASDPLVVAASPYPQDVDQTRHRGMFAPSNMIAHGPFIYAFVGTTGWPGQAFGACLMRTANPFDSASWRGYDGRAFVVRWRDPYKAGARAPEACAPVAPFDLPVGSVVRHRPSGLFLAVWEATRKPPKYPVAGFYYATSKDLLGWSAPALLWPGASVHDACDEGRARDGLTRAYPSIIDHHARTSTFEDVGDTAFLYFAVAKNVGCVASAERALMRAPLTITHTRGAAR